jgi:hypothetical protein
MYVSRGWVYTTKNNEILFLPDVIGRDDAWGLRPQKLMNYSAGSGAKLEEVHHCIRIYIARHPTSESP